jgi:hypothetical protein
MDEKTPEQPGQPELDPVWRALIERMVTDKTFGLQMSLHIQRNLEVHLEHLLADLVREYLASNTTLSAEQCSQIQMEIVPTQFQTHYIVNYALPGEPADQPHSVFCFWKGEQWRVFPLPGIPLA